MNIGLILGILIGASLIILLWLVVILSVVYGVRDLKKKK